MRDSSARVTWILGWQQDAVIVGVNNDVKVMQQTHSEATLQSAHFLDNPDFATDAD